ncbi:MAG TPA: dihydropteroate synthase [Mycobacteriales bacterium]|jgi:dihydropteroate synthase|nr:dihydropteroate synthase [Mycobacteriales bacterium]
MGVVNVTPDSFSDGGAFADTESAVEHGLALAAAGADIVDVGGESTRPGADRVSAEEERRRVEPVVAALAGAGVIVSIDTMRASTATAALDAGARIVNDVSGGRADPQLPAVVGSAGVPYVVMHWRAPSAQMQQHADYGDVVREVCDELQQRVDDVVAAGVSPECIIVDPGIGFAKTAEHNWALLADLDELLGLGWPLLVGASRKSFLGALLADESGPRPTAGRDDATAAVTVVAAMAGAWGVRVHDVQASADAVRVVARLRAETAAART